LPIVSDANPVTTAAAPQSLPGAQILTAPIDTPQARKDLGTAVGETLAAAVARDNAPDFGIDPSKALPGRTEREEGKALDKMTLTELLELRADIDKLLPPRELASLNLEEELVLQFHAVKDLQARVLGSRNEAANYQASVINSMTAVLKQVVDMQMSLHTTETVKAIEFAVERAFAGESVEVKTRFLERYQQALTEAVKPKKEGKASVK
jgi:hypothetical protein